MKASIDITGKLTVSPESEIEAYALRCYAKKFNSDDPPEICFAWEELHATARAARAAGEVT